MKPNCRGCDEEWCYACELSEDGNANLVQSDITHLGERKHFRVVMVNDKGDVIVQ